MEREQNTILLVEDDPTSRKLMRAVLASKGYRIAEAEDVDSGLAFLEKTLPDLVLLDMRLKASDGLDLVQAVRGNPRYDDMPIMAVTAQAMQDDQSRILAAGCDAYFSKPIDTRRLPELVRDLIEKGHGDAA